MIISKAFRGSSRVNRTVSRVAVAVREGVGSFVRQFRGSSRVSWTISRVAVAIREGTESFVGIQGKQQS